MRVIAGDMKGRPLKAVPGHSTRPTTDKIKEAIYQIIGPFFHGGKTLDLFAGSGSLGIEALSRGMDSCLFIDKNTSAIATIKQNVQKLKLDDCTEVYRTEAYRALQVTKKRGLTFDLILIDPPYGKISYEKFLARIMELGILQKNGIIYCEHNAETILPPFQGLTITKQVTYGNTTGITVYQCVNEIEH